MILKKQGEPSIRNKTGYQCTPLNKYAQRTYGIIHVLARMKYDISRPKPEEQLVPGYFEFHANNGNPHPQEQSWDTPMKELEIFIRN